MCIEPIRFNGSCHLHYYPTLPKILREVQPDIIHIDIETILMNAKIYDYLGLSAYDAKAITSSINFVGA